MEIDLEKKRAIDVFMQSSAFFRFVDEDIRGFAEKCVTDSIEAMEKEALQQNKKKVSKVKRTQLHSIPAVVQAGGLSELKELADKQAEKQSKQENRAFWNWFKGIIAPQGDVQEKTLPGQVLSRLRVFGFDLPDPSLISDKQKRKTQKKENTAYIAPVLENVLPAFCEHFICHYAYMVTED